MAKVTSIDGSKPKTPKEKKAEAKAEGPFNFQAAVEYATLIEEELVRVDEILEAAKKQAAPMREQIAIYYKQAAEDDVTKKVLKHVLSDRQNRRRQAAKLARLNAEQQANVKQLTLDLDLKKRSENPKQRPPNNTGCAWIAQCNGL